MGPSAFSWYTVGKDVMLSSIIRLIFMLSTFLWVTYHIVVKRLKKRQSINSRHFSGIWINPRRAAAINNDPPEKLKPPKPIKNMDKRERDEYACKVKLESIMPINNFNTATSLFMDHIQKTLKEVSDRFLQEERDNPDTQTKLKSGEIKSVEALREILGVMQVGALAGQINLKGETEFLAVLMTKNKPTFALLEKLAHKISEHMSQTYHENYKGEQPSHYR